MVVGAAGHKVNAVGNQHLGHGLAVVHRALLALTELRREALAKGHGLAGDHVHERATLQTREHGAVDGAAELLVAHDEPGARAAERLVHGGGHHVRNTHRARVHATGHQTRDVGHIHHQAGTHLVGDLAESREVEGARVSAGTSHDELWLYLVGLLANLIHVEAAGTGAHPVAVEVVHAAREVHLEPMREVAAVRKRHTHHLVAGLDEHAVGGLVGRGARVRLHVDVLAAEQLLGAGDGQILNLVHHLATAVVPLVRQALGVLVGEHRAHGLENGHAREVLAGDHLQRVGLALKLLAQQACNHGIGLGKRLGQVAV